MWEEEGMRRLDEERVCLIGAGDSTGVLVPLRDGTRDGVRYDGLEDIGVCHALVLKY